MYREYLIAIHSSGTAIFYNIRIIPVSITTCKRLYAFNREARIKAAIEQVPVLLEIIKECGNALERLLAALLDFDAELDFGLRHTAEVGNRLQVGDEADAFARLHCLAELHLVHSVVHHHLQVVHLDNLVPQVWQHGEREVAVRDGCLVWAFLLSLLCIDVDPLMVEGGIGKHVDALLRKFYVI